MAVDYLNVTPLHWAGRPQNVQILNSIQLLMASRSHPTWATGGAMGIYSWPVPVVIAGSLVSALGDPDDRSLKIPFSLNPYRY
jgi:hypothetical protein